MGGTDDSSNLIELTIEEHAEAHRELYEKYGKQEDLFAWKGLSGQWTKYQIHKAFSREGILHNETTKKKISMAKKGKKLSEEHKAKIIGTGRKQPERQKEAVRNSNSMNWIVTDPDGNTFEVRNLRQFAKEHGLDQGNLCKVANGICRQHKGYIVSYK